MSEAAEHRESLAGRIGIAIAATAMVLLVIWLGLSLQPQPSQPGNTGVDIGETAVSVEAESVE